jgi:hypothetical protein
MTNRVYKLISQKIRNQVLNRDGWVCQHCGCEPIQSHRIDVHHITPYVLGGEHELDNLIALCKPCHKKAERANRFEGFLDDADVIARIDAIAAAEGVPQSEIVRRAIRHFLFSLPTTPTFGDFPKDGRETTADDDAVAA